MGKKIYVSGPRKNAIFVRTRAPKALRHATGAFLLKKFLNKKLKHKFIDLYLFNKN